MATLNKSGRCVIATPTNKPPCEPPVIANFEFEVYCSLIKNSAASMKSLKVLIFF